MKTPRNVSASDLVRALKCLGYECVRQVGSHIRLTTEVGGTHHITICGGNIPFAKSPCAYPCRRRLLTAAVLIRSFLGS